ncbi:MAG: succinate dehydrogenase cytochrome b subunit [Candidatus Marinamargulisbacteria bacterium]
MIRLSTIQKKQWVGITGLAMVGFVLAHLSGNFLIFKGAEAYNGYAKFLHDLGPLLWVARLGLLSAFVVHMGLTMNLVITNKRARKARYYKYQNHRNESSLATRLMPLTGTVIFLYIIFHLLDFSLADKVGLIQGVEYGLFGLVVNTLGNPIHAVLYIIAMACVGLHMYHAFQSVFQTFGILSDRNQAVVSNVSKGLGVGIAIAYSAIPIYILLAF